MCRVRESKRLLLHLTAEGDKMYTWAIYLFSNELTLLREKLFD